MDIPVPEAKSRVLLWSPEFCSGPPDKTLPFGFAMCFVPGEPIVKKEEKEKKKKEKEKRGGGKGKKKKKREEKTKARSALAQTMHKKIAL